MATFSIYRLADGIFTGQRLSGHAGHLAANTPPGHAAWPGVVDHLRQRVQGGQLVPYLPPRPADNALQAWQLNEAGDAWQAVPTDDAIASQARAERARRLAATDWVTLRAADTQQPVPQAWQDYRQALRDISNQPGWPRDVQWPQPPGGI